MVDEVKAQNTQELQKEDVSKWERLEALLDANPRLVPDFLIDHVNRDNEGVFHYSDGYTKAAFYVNCNAIIVQQTVEPTDESPGSVTIESYVFDEHNYLNRMGGEEFFLPMKRSDDLSSVFIPAGRIESARFFRQLVDVTEGKGHEHCYLLTDMGDGKVGVKVRGINGTMLPSYEGMQVIDLFPHFSKLTAAKDAIYWSEIDVMNRLDPRTAHFARLALNSNLQKLYPVYCNPATGQTE